MEKVPVDEVAAVIAYHRQTLSTCNLDHPYRSSYIIDLANALLRRYERFGSVENLEEAIKYHREAIALSPPGHRNRFTSLTYMAQALERRYGKFSRIEDLEEGIAYHREATTICFPDYPFRSRCLLGLAEAIFKHFQRSGRLEDLDEAITYHREILSLHPPGHPGRSSSLFDISKPLFYRYERLGRMEDLEEVITYFREAFTLCPPGKPPPLSVMNLGNALFARYKRSARMQDLEEAITCQREALPQFPLDYPGRSAPLINISDSLRARYMQSGMMEDLDEAILYNREALALCPLGHPDRLKSLISITNTLCHQKLSKTEDLDEAILYSRETLALCPLGHPDRSKSLINLANILLSQKLSKTENLEAVITYLREALTLCPPGHQHRPRCLNDLANALLAHYCNSGRMEDLDEAITYYREVLSLRPPGHPGRSVILTNISDVLSTRYKQSGRMEDLNEAILYSREVLNLCPHDHPDRSRCLSHLAAIVLYHYEQSKRMEDLEDVITSFREVLNICPLGHPSRAISVLRFVSAVFRRYEKLGNIDDLEEAIKYSHEALTLYPLDHMWRSILLDNLAVTVLNRYRQSGRMEDLEDAIINTRQALIICPLDIDQTTFLVNLANAICYRYKQSGGVEDLEEAITSYRKALALCPLGHPARSNCFLSLANTVLVRYEQSRMMEDLEESFVLYEQAVNDSTASSKHRLAGAIQWADAARLHHHNSVVCAYSVSLCLLDRCLIAYPNLDWHENFLGTVHIPRSLISDAASAAIGANELETAVELLEQGRTILWSNMGGCRHPLDQLRQVDRQLADDLEKLTVELERLALSESELKDERFMLLAYLKTRTQRYCMRSEEWEELVGRVRKVEGFSTFLQPVPFSTLRTAAAEGPIILINISNYRSDAIILHVDNPPVLMTLPNVQPKHLTHLCGQLVSVQDPSVTDPSKLVSNILRDLWDGIVLPVVHHLTQLAVPQKSRIWWCPTFEFFALPLHAAGTYHHPQRNLSDMYISSYVPTVSALINARSHMIRQPNVPKLLCVGQFGDGVSNVQDEIDSVRQLGDFVDVIVGTDANRETVLHGLQQHSWAHFTCANHPGDDNTQPLHASFELDGGSRLTLLDLIQTGLPNAELAFLSACHRSAGDLSTPDKTIHLAAALHFCGFRSVVGSLWAMGDGPMISKEFYKCMFRSPENKADFRDSAESLDLVVREMRTKGVPLEHWIRFVHIGA